MFILCLAAALLVPPAPARAESPDIVFAGFEGADYGAWIAEGTAFGSGPAQRALPGEGTIRNAEGKGFATSFHGGDKAQGRLLSPEFTIGRRHIVLLVGGGPFPGEACVNLLVDGKVVRTASGSRGPDEDDELLVRTSWDVGDLEGRTARIEAVDRQADLRGHVTLGRIVFTDAPPAPLRPNVSRKIALEQPLLQFPVKDGAPFRRVTVAVDGRVERSFVIELAEDQPGWWAPLDVAAWKGKTAVVTVDALPEGARGLDLVAQDAALRGADNLYREPLRPQLHFSARRGWLNDPNGLVFYGGEYHLFFQHNPYGIQWGNMHWGHAVSRDLVHWTDLGEVLYPDASGTRYSGCAVVDWDNTTGLGAPGRPPLALLYTAAGNLRTQGLAWSVDGRTFRDYAGNPVVPQVTGGNRDPKVIWHAPTRRWIMALYILVVDPEKDAQGQVVRHDVIQFLASPDLKAWTPLSRLEGFYECPDIFPLPLDGDPAKTKWIVTGGAGNYQVGSFDGTTFTPEGPMVLDDGRKRGVYAAQTFSDEPQGRRIQVGWLKAPSPGMPFNEEMALPHELSLRTTPDGPRLARTPVPELASLRGPAFSAGAFSLRPGDPNPAAKAEGELLELRADFEAPSSGTVTFSLRGVPIVYDAAARTLAVNGVTVPAPPQGGRQRIVAYLDRTSIEVFASDGLVYLPVPVIPASDARSVAVSVQGGAVSFSALDVFAQRSIWSR